MNKHKRPYQPYATKYNQIQPDRDARAHFLRSWSALGALLDALGTLLGRSWTLLCVLVRRQAAILVPTWPPQAILERFVLQKATPGTPKIIKKTWEGRQNPRLSCLQRYIASEGLLGLIFIRSWATFGCSRGLLDTSWVLLGALGALLGRSWPLLGHSWGALGALLGRSWGALGALLDAL